MHATVERLKKASLLLAGGIVMTVLGTGMVLSYAVEWLWSLRPTKVLTTEQLHAELRKVAYHVRPYSDDLIKAVVEDPFYDGAVARWKVRKVPCLGFSHWIEIKVVRGAAIRIKVYG